MLVTRQWMLEKYSYYNDLLWNGELPPVAFIINNSTKTWGYATYKFDLWNDKVTPVSITMSNKFDSPEKVKISTLIHEMIHIADYYFNPHHFVRNGRKITGRQYDAHGYIYFIPQMNRINKILENEGIVISTCVTKEEQNQSQLNSVEKEKIKRKIENGVHVFVNKLKVNKGTYEYTVAVVHSSKYYEWKNYINASDWWHNEFQYTDDYLTTNERLAQKRTKKLGYSAYLATTLDNYIEKFNLKLNGRIYGDEPEQPTVKEPIAKQVEEPATVNTINDESHVVPMFRFKTAQGKLIELKNVTKAEIRLYLQGQFPNWGDKIIDNIMSHKSCYPMGENVVNLTEQELKEIAEDVVNNLNNSQTNQIPGQRRSKVKQISKYEYEESIE